MLVVTAAAAAAAAMSGVCCRVIIDWFLINRLIVTVAWLRRSTAVHVSVSQSRAELSLCALLVAQSQPPSADCSCLCLHSLDETTLPECPLVELYMYVVVMMMMIVYVETIYYYGLLFAPSLPAYWLQTSVILQVATYHEVV